MIDVVNSVRIAPSAANMQPWYIYFDKKIISIKNGEKNEETYKNFDIDMGIAMLHLELSMFNSNIVGTWAYQNRNSKADFLI
ncbi:hypothetical protein D3C76_1179400 [compost metagenome]